MCDTTVPSEISFILCASILWQNLNIRKHCHCFPHHKLLYSKSWMQDSYSQQPPKQLKLVISKILVLEFWSLICFSSTLPVHCGKFQKLSIALVMSLNISSLGVHIRHSCRVVHISHNITLLTVKTVYLILWTENENFEKYVARYPPLTYFLLCLSIYASELDIVKYCHVLSYDTRGLDW
jgi:hypothetical protein